MLRYVDSWDALQEVITSLNPKSWPLDWRLSLDANKMDLVLG